MSWIFVLFGFQTIIGTIAAIWILFRWDQLFRKIPWINFRRRLKIICITCCFFAAYQPANYGWYKMSNGVQSYLLYGAYFYMCGLALLTSLVYQWVIDSSWYKKQKQYKQQITAFIILALTPMLSEIAISPLSGFKGIYLTDNLSFTLWAGCFAGTVLMFFNNYASQQRIQLQQKELELVKLSQLNTQTTLDALQAKINPHFLYNTLNAMAGLALEDGPKTSKMAVALSVLFRYNLNKEQGNFSSVLDEIEMTQHYLSIEKIRFEERLQYSFVVDEAMETQLIPKFILQPLVENCIKHSFVGMNKVGLIEVQIKKLENSLLIEVADNGLPFAPNFILGFGLQSLHDKLTLFYPNKHKIEFNNDPKKISITLPIYATPI